MSYSLNSLKGESYRGFYTKTTIGVIKGDTRSLDSSSHKNLGYHTGVGLFLALGQFREDGGQRSSTVLKLAFGELGMKV